MPDRTDAPILALVHPGGETMRSTSPRAGGQGGLAEGGEHEVLVHLDADRDPDPGAAVRFHEAYESVTAATGSGCASRQSVDSAVVGPDELVRTLAPTTESETALRLLDDVGRDDPTRRARPPGRGAGRRPGAAATRPGVRRPVRRHGSGRVTPTGA